MPLTVEEHRRIWQVLVFEVIASLMDLSAALWGPFPFLFYIIELGTSSCFIVCLCC